MKRLLILCLVLCMMLSLVACGTNDNKEKEPLAPSEEYTEPLETPEEIPEESTKEEPEFNEEDYKTILSRMKNYSRDIDAEIRVMASAIAKGTPLPKGHWIEVDNGYICSECDIIRAKGTTGKYNYCPNCGADMRGEQE